MKIIDSLKQNIGQYLLQKKFIKENKEIVQYNKFFSESINFLVMMPTDEHDFNNCFEILRFFLIHKKNVYLVVPEYKVSLVPEYNRYKHIKYTLDNKNKLGLPTKEFISEIMKKEFDVVVDLNRDDDLFLSAISTSVDVKFRIGFRKEKSDLLYNFQIPADQINSEISYRNLLNSLRMF